MVQQAYRRRRGAAVMARRQDNTQAILLGALLGLALLMMAATGFAQNATPAPAPPQAPGVQNGNSGVIQPPTQVDPGIKAKPPVPQSSLPTPVIPPPGTAGGNQQVQPK